MLTVSRGSTGSPSNSGGRISCSSWRLRPVSTAGRSRWRVELEQKPGYLVHGWIHCVENERPNLKLAWDAYRLCNLHLYIEAHRTVICEVFKHGMAPDYMAINTLLVGGLCRDG